MWQIRIPNEIKELKESPILNCSAGPKNDDLMIWEATIFGPKDTPYDGGVFTLDIDFTKEYPLKPPRVLFKTPIYHCNINTQGAICLDILKDKWSPALTVGQLLLSICSVMSDPNPDDPLVPEIAESLLKNKDVHDANAREMTFRYANK